MKDESDPRKRSTAIAVSEVQAEMYDAGRRCPKTNGIP